jgi:flagellar biosynthesis chaperone FliJ
MNEEQLRKHSKNIKNIMDIKEELRRELSRSCGAELSLEDVDKIAISFRSAARQFKLLVARMSAMARFYSRLETKIQKNKAKWTRKRLVKYYRSPSPRRYVRAIKAGN